VRIRHRSFHICSRSADLLLALASALGSVACTSETGPERTEGVVVGLMLPFTGPDSATAANFERAALYAADRVNQGGGVQGEPLSIISADTHSERARSHRAAQSSSTRALA
jgi:neutral amino acid transport system substrate-binding protein